MLTIVLVGFSAGVYLLAAYYLNLEAHGRLINALNALGNIVEIGTNGVEWDTADRTLESDLPILGFPVVWLVSDEQGQLIQQSPGPESGRFFDVNNSSLKFDSNNQKEMNWSNSNWIVRQKWFLSKTGAKNLASEHLTDLSDHDVKFPALSITVGLSLKPLRWTLQTLSLSLIWVSVAIWFIALLASRFVCRRALQPLTRMSVAVREIDATDLAHQRLPIVDTRDELQDLNQSFNNLLDRLQETFERQRRFTGDASHQLRTPLTAITGQIEVALRRERRAEDYRQVLVTVGQKTQHLTKLVEALLFLARSDSESTRPELTSVDLVQWLPQHLDTWSQHVRHKDFQYDCDATEPCQIQAQPALLTELINILTDNACKYSEPGTPINIRLSKANNQIELAVEDQGYGIEPNDLVNLFTPFFRATAARERGIEGVGLGLSIAKRLATLFDGELTTTSQPGKGSCFTLRFA